MVKNAKAGNQGNGTQSLLGLDDPCYNNGLFADNYLDKRITNLPEWKQVSDEELKPIFVRIAEIYNKHAVNFTDDTNEAVTEKDFIMPVLDVLRCRTIKPAPSAVFDRRIHVPRTLQAQDAQVASSL